MAQGVRGSKMKKVKNMQKWANGSETLGKINKMQF